MNKQKGFAPIVVVLIVGVVAVLAVGGYVALKQGDVVVSSSQSDAARQATPKPKAATPATPRPVATQATHLSPSIRVTSPNGSDQWTIGSSQTISWTQTGTLPANGRVLVRLTSRVGASETIYPLTTLSVANGTTAKTYTWVIPPAIGATTLAAGSTYRIQVVAADGPSIGATTVALDESDATFSLVSNASSPRPLACGFIGDVNFDGKITTDDYNLQGRIAAGNEPNFTSYNEFSKAADVNGDGRFTVADWILEGRYVQGADTTFPACATTTTVTVSRPRPCNTVGDVNFDGIINMSDWAFQGTIIAGLVPLTDALRKAADLNGDARISIADLQLEGRFVQGLDTTFPACNTAN